MLMVDAVAHTQHLFSVKQVLDSAVQEEQDQYEHMPSCSPNMDPILVMSSRRF